MAQFPEQRPQQDGTPALPVTPGLAIVIGDGQFGMTAVETADYQHELELITGGRGDQSADFLCGALLVPEPKNPRNPNAVAVTIASRVVGYLQPDAGPSLKLALRAGSFVAAGCAARIVGGAKRAGGGHDDFGVRLDASQPFQMRSIAKKVMTAPPLVVPQRDEPAKPAHADPPVRTTPARDPIARDNPIARLAADRSFPVARPAEQDFPVARQAVDLDLPVARPTPDRDFPVERPAPDRDFPVMRPTPQIERDPFADRSYEPEDVKVPPPRGRFASLILDIVLIALIVTAGAWWVQRLPREPQTIATPAAAPPAEPAPLPVDQTPSIWQGIPPPNIQAPQPVPAEPAPPTQPSATEPPSAATPEAPAAAPIPRSKPAPEKGRPKPKQAEPKVDPKNAPLQLH